MWSFCKKRGKEKTVRDPARRPHRGRGRHPVARGKEKTAKESALRVALIGEDYRRDYLKRQLGGRIEVAGELAADRRVDLLAEVEPEVVIVDCGSRGVNPLATLPLLAVLEGCPRIIALWDVCLAGAGKDVLSDLGADAVAVLRDASAVARALGLDGQPTEENCTAHIPAAA